MPCNLETIADSELGMIWGGGNIHSNGWKGGGVNFSNGNSIEVTPLSTTVNLTSESANKLANNLGLASAVYLKNHTAGASFAIGGAVVSKMNEDGKGISIRIPHTPLPPIITPKY